MFVEGKRSRNVIDYLNKFIKFFHISNLQAASAHTLLLHVNHRLLIISHDFKPTKAQSELLINKYHIFVPKLLGLVILAKLKSCSTDLTVPIPIHFTGCTQFTTTYSLHLRHLHIFKLKLCYFACYHRTSDTWQSGGHKLVITASCHVIMHDSRWSSEGLSPASARTSPQV